MGFGFSEESGLEKNEVVKWEVLENWKWLKKLGVPKDENERMGMGWKMREWK